MPGTVALCAWAEGRTTILSPDFSTDHVDTLRRLRVPRRRVVLEWEYTACRAFRGAVAPGDGDDLLCINCGLEPYDLNRKDVEVYCRSEPDRKHGVPAYLAEWTASTIQALLLIHVLVHELGHHHDRMTSPRQRTGTRGEQYALTYEQEIWLKYCRVFRLG